MSGADGSLISGLHFYGVRLRTPSLRAEAAEVYLRPAIREIAAGRPALSELRVVSPRITLLPAGKERPAARPVLPAVRLAVITGGRLDYAGKTYSDIDCRFSISGGKVKISSCEASASGATAVFSGAYYPGRVSARGRLDYPAGRTALRFDYSLSGAKQSFLAKGAVSGTPLKFSGKLDGGRWAADLSLQGPLPLDAFFPSLNPVKLRASSLSAAGTGFSTNTVSAAGKFSIDGGAGRAAEGTFTFNRGDAGIKAAYAYGGISGAIDAALMRGTLAGSLRAAGGGNFELPTGWPLSFNRGKAACSLGGSLKAPSADCEADAEEVKSGGFTADAVKSSGAFFAGPSEAFRFGLSIVNPVLSGIRLNSAALRAEGFRAKNTFAMHFDYPAGGVALSGSSSYKNGVWTAELGELSLSRLPEWRLCSPAALNISAGAGVEVSGLCLASGPGRLSFSGVFKAPFPEEFHAAITDLALVEIEKAGLFKLRPGGVLNASVNYSAKKAADGIFSVSAENVELGGLGLGSARAGGTFSRGKARLEEAAWKIYGGEATASGWFAISGGKPAADFNIKASSMNVAPLLALFPQVSAGQVWVDGESRLRLNGDDITSSGAINLTAPKLALIPLGLELHNTRVRLEAGDLSSARITASARKNGGKMAAEGTLSAGGPGIKVTASDLPFSHPSGLNGKAAADLLLAGTWREPELSGAVDLGEAKFEMEKWDKYAPPKEKSRFYEAMSIDVKIAAERNAWYREGANSVEVAGTLLLKKDHYRQPVALGTINALKGYYVYLGNTFTVNSGRLTFTGETPPNPAIEVSASNEERGSPMKVYFNAAGKARNPQVTLSSDPPMEQRDIISFLVTGKPLYELYAPRNAPQQGRTGDNTAQNIAAGYISQKAAATVGKKLEIDMINLKVTAEKKADITVGRYITRDLFISYGQVLGQGGEKRVSAEYSITRHWSLEGKNSSDGRYVTDLLFKYGIK